eukprot:CAMPEP_0201592964 /NCGR_PEP_ID=MMETSP0190_2-20130828/190703_1 /ASSEMBLY_ACC=CAM_ASM_000263 /TAXON_ID=37353 /ORGANISM="Rosalina sp." /LENGTH=102 /DNA_ID=CAMNT_0048051947 /DNA_START=771 /DNA_END=1076 /DNA_ORIENTATION=+
MDQINVGGITGGDDTKNESERAEIATSGDETSPSSKADAGDGGWDAKQEELVKTATRLFVVAMVSFVSSIFYQLLFAIAILEEFEGTGTHGHTVLYYFSFTW